MGGGISFKNDEYWSAAGWCFRGVVESIVEYLSKQDAFDLYEHFTNEECIELLVGHIDMTAWPDAKANFFCGAIIHGFDLCKIKGGGDWNQPEHFDGFIKKFEELVGLAKAAQTN